MENEGDSSDIEMNGSTHPAPKQPDARTSMESYITRTANEDLPYLFVGSGSCSPLDPKASHCLGLALVRSINTRTRKLEIVTPIAADHIRHALEQGHGIVLVRGQLDNPNWAISEEYYAARAAAQRHQRRVAQARKAKHDEEEERGGSDDDDDDDDGADDDRTTLAMTNIKQQAQMRDKLQERIRRASQAPWMTVIEDDGRRQREVAQRERSLWKLRKKVYAGSGSEMD